MFRQYLNYLRQWVYIPYPNALLHPVNSMYVSKIHFAINNFISITFPLANQTGSAKDVY